jgi:coiled-coil and C2 domain-containing protein 2A
LRQTEGYNNRQLLSNLLITWRDLKKLRELQGYTSTQLQLHIHKEYAEDPAAEIKAWDEEIRKEIEELEEEYQEEYNKQLDEYSNKLTLWKKRRKALVGLNKTSRTNIGVAFWGSLLYYRHYKENGFQTDVPK